MKAICFLADGDVLKIKIKRTQAMGAFCREYQTPVQQCKV